MPVTIRGGLGPHKWRDRRHLDALAKRVSPNRVLLIADDDDRVLEAAWANVWLLNGDHLSAPPADGRNLPGVTTRVCCLWRPPSACRPTRHRFR